MSQEIKMEKDFPLVYIQLYLCFKSVPFYKKKKYFNEANVNTASNKEKSKFNSKAEIKQILKI